MDVYGITPYDVVTYVSKTKDTPVEEFLAYCKKNDLRKGQAWMNALSREDYIKLSDSRFDPFFSDVWASLCGALAYLVDPNIHPHELIRAIDRAAGQS